MHLHAQDTNKSRKSNAQLSSFLSICILLGCADHAYEFGIFLGSKELHRRAYRGVFLSADPLRLYGAAGAGPGRRRSSLWRHRAAKGGAGWGDHRAVKRICWLKGSADWRILRRCGCCSWDPMQLVRSGADRARIPSPGGGPPDGPLVACPSPRRVTSRIASRVTAAGTQNTSAVARP